jgi:RNA polymerase sigma-70 factor, ECF subfamily
MPANLSQSATALSDKEIVERILGGETDLYELIIRRHHRRLYRVTQAIVRKRHEAEDVIQATHVRAYEYLVNFGARPRFSAWLIGIAVHEAWARMRRQSKQFEIDMPTGSSRTAGCVTHTPEDDVLVIETRTILNQEIAALPSGLRSVFLMRSLEEKSTAEIAKCLDITEGNVKTRLLRARHILRRALYWRALAVSGKAFRSPDEPRDRLTASILFRTW